ncbi:MAG TPA: VOC family protein [Chthoniobacterales bacterium]|jgi:catechol 2,3-dioxygenase-like lactoylglutathione lyase family enzyme|nr:VOC family protein [Chthoniobacterales bacterium]
MSFRILAADHTGITVSNIEHSLEFWRDVLGFELSHRAHQKGELAEQITGKVIANLEAMKRISEIFVASWFPD